MKTKFALSMCILLSGAVYAQQNTYPPVGNVGIGTTNPSEKLEVMGNVRIDGLAAPGLGIRPVYVDESGKLVVNREAIPGGGSGIHGNLNPDCNPGNFWKFTPFSSTTSGITGGIIYTCDPNYKVGIGTDAPTARLEVVGNIIGQSLSAANTASRLGLYANTATTGASIELFGKDYTALPGLVRISAVNDGQNSTQGFLFENIANGSRNKDFLITASGNVGIGTLSPVAKLDINGNVLVRGSITASAYTGSNTRKLLVTANGEMAAAANEWSTVNNDIYNLNSGNVGIGTDAPVSKLHVNGWIGLGVLSDNVWISHLRNYAPGIQFRSGGNDFLAITSVENANKSQLLFYTGRNPDDGVLFRNYDVSTGATHDYLSIDRNLMYYTGRMGIGTNTPVSPLNVNGWITLGYQNDNGWLAHIQQYAPGIQFRSMSNDFLAITSVENGLKSDMVFYTGDNAEDGIIYRTRYLDTDGTTYIDDDYLVLNKDLLKYKGTILVKELRVKHPSKWADYVFEENYPLKSLCEVEQYVKLNKHLENIPSASEIESSGINVADMNRLLLEKIEELTLYLIRSDKQIQEMQKEIELLKTK